MKSIVLINEHGGGVQSLGVKDCIELVRSHLTDEFEIATAAGDPKALVERAASAAAAGASRVISIGGDGTTAAIAGALAGTNVALAPLPGGTMNIFARDLGYPASLTAAIEVLPNAGIRKVDIAYANEYAFLNNIVFGAYASVADARELLREATGIDETLGAVSEIVESITHSDTEKYEIVTDGAKMTIQTNTLMISNNMYDGADFPRPLRARLDAGVLGLYAANSQSPMDFINVLLDAVSGNLSESEIVDVQICKTCKVSWKGALFDVTIDGDTVELASPITVRLHQAALIVLASDLSVAKTN